MAAPVMVTPSSTVRQMVSATSSVGCKLGPGRRGDQASRTFILTPQDPLSRHYILCLIGSLPDRTHALRIRKSHLSLRAPLDGNYMSSTRYGSGSAAIVRGMHQYWTGRIGQSRAGGGGSGFGITPEGKAGVVDVQEGEGGREGASFEMTIYSLDTWLAELVHRAGLHGQR